MSRSDWLRNNGRLRASVSVVASTTNSLTPTAVPSPPLGDPMTAGHVTGEPSYAMRLTDRVNPSCLNTTWQIAVNVDPDSCYVNQRTDVQSQSEHQETGVS